MIDSEFTDEGFVSVSEKQAEKEWLDTYGFPHHCHCRQDWDEGKVVEVSECYFRMSIDALEALEKIRRDFKLMNIG